MSGEPCERCGGWLHKDGSHETILDESRCAEARARDELRAVNGNFSDGPSQVSFERSG